MSVLPADPVRDHCKRLLKWALAIALMAAILSLITISIRLASSFFAALSQMAGNLLA